MNGSSNYGQMQTAVTGMNLVLFKWKLGKIHNNISQAFPGMNLVLFKWKLGKIHNNISQAFPLTAVCICP